MIGVKVNARIKITSIVINAKIFSVNPAARGPWIAGGNEEAVLVAILKYLAGRRKHFSTRDHVYFHFGLMSHFVHVIHITQESKFVLVDEYIWF